MAELPASAQAAWRAFCAMSDTKSAHLSLLEHFEELRDEGRSPSIAEQLKLEGLLAEHDTAVKGFAKAMADLKQADPTAIAPLMAAINDGA